MKEVCKFESEENDYTFFFFQVIVGGIWYPISPQENAVCIFSPICFPFPVLMSTGCRAPSRANLLSPARSWIISGAEGKGKLTTRWIFIAFICRRRSSTGLRCISGTWETSFIILIYNIKIKTSLKKFRFGLLFALKLKFFGSSFFFYHKNVFLWLKKKLEKD